MKVFAIVLVCCIAAVSSNHCYSDVIKDCSKDDITDYKGCEAKFGNGHKYIGTLNDYINEHVTQSMEYLLMSTHFGTWVQEREGFEKLFRKLSDETWEDAIELIKYVTMRGGEVILKPFVETESYPDVSGAKETTTAKENKGNNTYAESVQSNEVVSLGKAVDIQKKLASRAHKIYSHVISDPEMGSYMQEQFMHKQAKTVRSLVGLANDLNQLVRVKDDKTVGLHYYIMDEYLKKYV